MNFDFNPVPDLEPRTILKGAPISILEPSQLASKLPHEPSKIQSRFAPRTLQNELPFHPPGASKMRPKWLQNEVVNAIGAGASRWSLLPTLCCDITPPKMGLPPGPPGGREHKENPGPTASPGKSWSGSGFQFFFRKNLGYFLF